MRPRGREVEKRVGSALSVTPKNGKFHRKSGLVRNQVWIVPRYVLRTFEAADAAQVDALDVLDVRQVLRQRELAAVRQVDAVLAVLRANVADHANDRAGEDACVEDEK